MKTGKITFRPLRENDLSLLHRWLNTPHVSEWWSVDGNHNPTLEEVAAHYTPRITAVENVDCYIIHYEGKPIGMIQSYDLDKEPEEKILFGLGGKCTGLDMLIGEEDYAHRGLGAVIIRSFLRDIVFERVETECAVIDPSSDNKIARRAYEKAGFKYLRTVWYEPDHVYEAIMTISRSEIMGGKRVQSC
jgi:RimJ/RimL family protein N-acetyltransferase